MLPIHSRQHGFTLIETTIVLAIMLILTVLVMAGMRYTSQSTSRENYVTIQAREMALMQSALKKYAADHDATFTSGTAVTVSVASLITAGLLPTDFANRNGAVGTSPMFQPYLLIGRKDPATNQVATVVAESSTPLGSRLQQMGLVANDPMVLAFKQQVAEEANKVFKVTAGTVDKNTTVARGVFGGFTKDLAVFLGGAVAAADAVVLQGFPDLDPPGDITAGNKWKRCVWRQATNYNTPNGKYNQPACPAGYQQLAKTPYCNYNATSLVYPSDVGSIFLSQRTTEEEAVLIRDWTCPRPEDSTCTSDNQRPIYEYAHNRRTYVDVQLNGAIIATDAVMGRACEKTEFRQGAYNLWGNCIETATVDGFSKPCITGGFMTPEGQIARNDIGADPYDILCCSDH